MASASGFGSFYVTNPADSSRVYSTSEEDAKYFNSRPPGYLGPPVSWIPPTAPRSPWYNPYSNQSWLDSYDKQFFNSQEGAQSAWRNLTSRTNAPSRAKGWLDNQYQKYYDLYSGQVAGNLGLNWTDYLAGLDLQGMYNAEAPQTRGLNSSGLATRMKYIGW